MTTLVQGGSPQCTAALEIHHCPYTKGALSFPRHEVTLMGEKVLVRVIKRTAPTVVLNGIDLGAQARSSMVPGLTVSDPTTAPHAYGVLVIDETGDRQWEIETGHVGRPYPGPPAPRSLLSRQIIRSLAGGAQLFRGPEPGCWGAA